MATAPPVMPPLPLRRAPAPAAHGALQLVALPLAVVLVATAVLVATDALQAIEAAPAAAAAAALAAPSRAPPSAAPPAVPARGTTVPDAASVHFPAELPADEAAPSF